MNDRPRNWPYVQTTVWPRGIIDALKQPLTYVEVPDYDKRRKGSRHRGAAARDTQQPAGAAKGHDPDDGPSGGGIDPQAGG